jgi:hypothetical protein
MTVEILEKYPPKERAGILASIALATSPNPAVERRELSADQLAILAAIVQQAGVAGDPFSGEARAKVDALIMKALTELVLADVNVDALLKAAGSAGQLPPRMYEVVVPQPFLSLFAQFNVRESDVQSTVLNAEDVQHLGSEPDQCVSLFSRLVVSKEGRDPFWAVAQFVRGGNILHAQHFWRVYPSEIDLSKAQKPADLIEALVKTVGQEITVNDRRLRYARDMPVPATNAGTIELVVPTTPGDETIATVSAGVVRPDGTSEIILAYGVSNIRYREYLKRHNVSLAPLRQPLNGVQQKLIIMRAPRAGS